MQKTSTHVVMGFLLLWALSAQAFAASFVRLSSLENHAGTVEPQIISLKQTDGTEDITHGKETITFKTAGSYFVLAAAQVGSAGNGKGTVKLWLRRNGKDVDNSNTAQSVTPGFTGVLVAQSVLDVKSGDTLQCVFSVSNPGDGLGLVSSPSSSAPAMPSLTVSAFKIDGSAFAQLSSTQTQPASATAQAVVLHQTDTAKEIKHTNGTITFQKEGLYFVVAAGQVGGGSGVVKLWLRRNGRDTDNSNTAQSLSDGFTSVLVSQTLLPAKAGDTLQLVQSVDGTGGMVATKPKGEPTIPSMMFSAFRVDAKAYAQLSSLTTQMATGKGTLVFLGIDAVKGMDNTLGRLTVKEAGTYFVIAGGQAGATNQGTGAVKLWLQHNGQDVDNSSTEQTTNGAFTTVVICQAVMQLKAGDTIALSQSVKGSGGMIYSRPKGEPAIPSMIVSIVRID